MTEKKYRMPIKSPSTGFTLALMSKDGLELYCKHTRRWEVHSIDEIIHIYEEVTKLTTTSNNQDKTA